MENHPRASVAISVVIVNFNAGQRLRQCLDRLTVQTFQDFEVIVVDNASSDDSIEMARHSSTDFDLIELGDNLGFAVANNVAAEKARGAWLALLNPDAYAECDWLEQLWSATKRHPDVDAFGSTQIDAMDRNIIDGVGDVYHAFGLFYRGGHGWRVERLPPEGECFSPCAAAAFVRKQRFLDLGGFYEPFFCYAEDIDFGFRLRLQGGRCIQVRDAHVYHEGSGIAGRKSDFAVYHGHRNRIWTYYLNMPLTLLAVTFPFHIAINTALFFFSLAEGTTLAYAQALWDAHKDMSSLQVERSKRQREREVSAGTIADALTWSLTKALRRSPDLRVL